ncbi:MAG: hypothetical protein ACOX57_08905 [Limnochordia bacterium]
MAKPVGFDQKILLEEMDYVASEVSNSSRTEMYEKLDQFLLPRVKGDKSRKNAITILMKIWCRVDDSHVNLQEQALDLLPKLPSNQQLAIHWGMTLLAYPFFHDLVKELGSLFMLQDEVASSQINRKMKSIYGDRRRVEVATGAVLSSLYSWKVVKRNKTGYKYNQTVLEDARLKVWLLNVLLQLSGSNVAALDVLTGSPAVFPFKCQVSPLDFEDSPLSISRQGIDMTVVSIR